MKTAHNHEQISEFLRIAAENVKVQLVDGMPTTPEDCRKVYDELREMYDSSTEPYETRLSIWRAKEKIWIFPLAQMSNTDDGDGYTEYIRRIGKFSK